MSHARKLYFSASKTSEGERRLLKVSYPNLSDAESEQHAKYLEPIRSSSVQQYFPLSRIRQVDNLTHPFMCACYPRSQLCLAAELPGQLVG